LGLVKGGIAQEVDRASEGQRYQGVDDVWVLIPTLDLLLDLGSDSGFFFSQSRRCGPWACSHLARLPDNHRIWMILKLDE
jgi:hypothetical protein